MNKNEVFIVRIQGRLHLYKEQATVEHTFNKFTRQALLKKWPLTYTKSSQADSLKIQQKIMSLERVYAPCQFLLDKIEISLFFYEHECNNLTREIKNACQPLSHVNFKPQWEDRRLFDYFGINKILSSKGVAKKHIIS